MALKDNWTDLVDNESYIRAEDINKIASAVIESEGDIATLGSKANDLETKKADAYRWEQIDKFTTEEDALINKDYSSHNIEGIRILISVPANTVSTTRNMNSYVTTGSSGNIWCGYYSINIGDATKNQSIICTTVKEFGLWTTTFSSYQDDYNIKRGATSSNVECISPSNKYIKKLMSQHTIPKGATITVYGAFPVTE